MKQRIQIALFAPPLLERAAHDTMLAADTAIFLLLEDGDDLGLTELTGTLERAPEDRGILWRNLYFEAS